MPFEVLFRQGFVEGGGVLARGEKEGGAVWVGMVEFQTSGKKAIVSCCKFVCV